jgi:hypothetical protein
MDHEFRVLISTDKKTGRQMAVYFQVRRGKAAKVREFENGNAFANYDEQGELLGNEMLGPCHIKAVDRIAKQDPDVKRFVRANAPRKMLLAGA